MALVTEMEVRPADVRIPRSHLGTNQFLVLLGQVFGVSSFTSRMAADRLGFDFLHVAKILFRMRKQNLLRVNGRIPRRWGGYENSYEISRRGRCKITYLLSKQVATSTPTPPKQEPTMFGQICASHYLLNGTGRMGEMVGHAFLKSAVQSVRMPPITDELGMVLGSIEPALIQKETLGNRICPSLHESPYWRTVIRAAGLQELGYVPSDVDLPLFVGNAMLRGSSEHVILLGLILRESMRLKAENDLATRMREAFGRTGKLICPSCCAFQFELDRYRVDCEDLKQKLELASLKAQIQELTHQDQLRNMHSRIHGNLEFLTVILQELNKFPNTDLTVPVIKTFISQAFTTLAYINYRARNYCLDS